MMISKVKKLTRDAKIKMLRLFYRLKRRDDGLAIMGEDWDNLIILDGCRCDAFKKINDMKGEMKCISSKGSHTEEFLEKNFKNKEFKDTVYVTANPLVNKNVKDSFYEVVPVWLDDWCEKYGTVLPDTMTRRVSESHKKHPHKRLIAHYVQPHYPFIGKTGREKIGEHEGMLSRKNYLSDEEVEHTDQLIWNLLREGKVEKSIIWEAYLENLKIALEEVKNLMNHLKGKTVITSDHGNLFGEFLSPLPVREYGHPSGIYHEKLISVPWFIIEDGKRKVIREGNTKKEEEMINDAISRVKI